MANDNGKIKTIEGKSIKDTDLLISWVDFIEIAKAYGFKSGYCHKFIGEFPKDTPIEEEEIIFFNEEKGLILYAESFNNHMNSAIIYGEVKSKHKNSFDALNGCSFGSNKNGTIHFFVDVREGLRRHLDRLSDAFEFSKSWSETPFLWFLNYMDTKDENYNFKEITKKKIESSSPEVKHIIFG